MKARNMQEMIRAKEQIERGAATPAKVWDVRSDGKGGFTRRAVDPKAFRRAQNVAWDKSIAATRQKLGLSQGRFARLLGISVRIIGNKEPGPPVALHACYCGSRRGTPRRSWPHKGFRMEPAVGIEPTTRSLQNCCSTTELSWPECSLDRCPKEGWCQA